MPENLYRRGGTWWARASIDGKDVRRSLRTGLKAEAVKRRRKFLEELDHARFWGEERHTWAEAIAGWSEHAAKSLGPATYERYLTSLRQAHPILKDLYVDEIDERQVAKIAFRKGPSNATRRRDLTAVSHVLRWCKANGWVRANVAHLWERDAIPEKRDPIILPTADEIDALVSACPGNFANLVRFLQYSGVRQEEGASLEWSMFDRRRGAIQIKVKRNRTRSVKIDARAVGTIIGTARQLKAAGFVFWHGAGERYEDVKGKFTRIRARLNRARVAEGLEALRFRCHDLRHWYAVDFLRRGGSLADLQEHLGHSSVATTEIYTKFLTPEEARKARRVGTIPGTGRPV